MSTYDILRRPASYSNHLQRRYARLVSPHMQILARRSGDRDWQPAITQQSAAPQLSRARCRPCVDRRRAHTTTFPTFQGWGCYRTVTGAWPSCPGPTCSLRPVQSLKLTRGSSPRTVLAQHVQLLPRGRLLLVSARRILGRPVDDSLLYRVSDGYCEERASMVSRPSAARELPPRAPEHPSGDLRRSYSWYEPHAYACAGVSSRRVPRPLRCAALWSSGVWTHASRSQTLPHLVAGHSPLGRSPPSSAQYLY